MRALVRSRRVGGRAEADVAEAVAQRGQVGQRLVQVPDRHGAVGIEAGFLDQLGVLLDGAADHVRDDGDGIRAAVENVIGPFFVAVDVVVGHRAAVVPMRECAVIHQQDLIVADEADGLIELTAQLAAGRIGDAERGSLELVQEMHWVEGKPENRDLFHLLALLLSCPEMRL